MHKSLTNGAPKPNCNQFSSIPVDTFASNTQTHLHIQNPGRVEISAQVYLFSAFKHLLQAEGQY